MSAHILITGSQGFLGSHLTRFLKTRGFQVSAPMLDVTDSAAIAITAKEIKNIDTIVHLAGLSFAPDSDRAPQQAELVNTHAPSFVFKQFIETNPNLTFVFPSTGQIYGRGKGSGAINESFPSEPINNYAKLKLEGERLLKEKSNALGGQVVVCRLFNHVHKTQDPRFFLPRIYHEILKLKRSSSSGPMMVGNLDQVRDIGAIQDIMIAFEGIINKRDQLASYQLFNLASGTGKNLRKLAELLIERLEFSVALKTDPKLVRDEPHSIVADIAKISHFLDWMPVATSEEKLIDLFLADLDMN